MFQITGSIGSSAFPSRVFKGMRMSGHMGDERVTVRNLRVLGVDKDENLLVVEGSVPGPQRRIHRDHARRRSHPESVVDSRVRLRSIR